MQVFADPLEDKLNQLNSWYEKGLIDAADYARSKTDLLKTFTENQRLVEKTPARRQIIQQQNLIAIIPFYGKVYSDGDRDTMAKFSVKNIRLYIERQQYHLGGGILDFHLAKRALFEDHSLLDPDQPYSNEFLANAARSLNVRYLLFGQVNHYAFTPQVYRFNVECKVFDAKIGEIVFTKRARQSSMKKLFNVVQHDKGKTIGKISEQFYFFIDQLASERGMKPARKEKTSVLRFR